jgi:hypothetical protein
MNCLASTGIISWCSSGRHCFAHPATPQQIRRNPAMPTPALVTRLANKSIMPKARSIGHAVLAGISIGSL